MAEGNRTNTLHVGSPGEPGGLDPHIIIAPPDFRIVPMLFEGLVKGNPATLEPEPGVADSWTVAEDGVTHTFRIREDARWSNGDPITSSDFLFSWERALTPALGSQYTFLFTDVVGADEFNTGRSLDFATVGFSAPDSRTVVVVLKQPTPYFLASMANNAIWFPVHRPTIEAAGAMADRNSRWTEPGTMVSNGPFKLATWRPNEFVRLEKSETYWNASSVALDALVYHAFDNPININTLIPPFDDVRVRRAFALAINRDDLARHVYMDTAVAARRVVPTGMPSYPTDEDFVDNAEIARQLLAEAGFPDGAWFPAVELSTEAGGAVNLPEALQAQWQENLNVHVAILNSETRVHWDKLKQKDYTLAIGGWTADYPDATTYLDLWKEGSGYNFTNWTDPAYDESLVFAAAQKDSSSRKAALRKAEGFLMEHMPIIPLVFEKDVMLHHPSMKNFTANAMDRPDYSTVTLTTQP